MAHTKRGFTLIELLVVIGVIGILAVVVMANLGSARARGRDTKRKSDLKAVQAALDQYYSNQNQYPSGAYSALPLTPSYIPALPHDPFCPSGTCSGSWSDYAYSRACVGGGCTTSQGYYARARLENPDDPEKKVIGGVNYYQVCGGNNGGDPNCSPI